LEAILAFRAFPDGELEKEGHSLFVFFLRSKLAKPAQDAVEALHTERDEFRVQGREIYWLCRGRMMDSMITPADMARATGKSECTTRNITTIRKLVEKHSCGAGASKLRTLPGNFAG
jgi:uncharacterized protein (DUF1697 family)